jgi:hypothetical protein
VSPPRHFLTKTPLACTLPSVLGGIEKLCIVDEGNTWKRDVAAKFDDLKVLYLAESGPDLDECILSDKDMAIQ